MTFWEFVLLLAVAGLIGALGQAIVGYSRGGYLVSIAVGFIGALLGTWLARKMSLPDIYVLDIGGTRVPIVWSIVGSALFIALISLLSRRPRA